MAKRYKHPRMDLDSLANFYKKREVLEQIARENGIKKKIHMTDVFRFFSQKQIMVYPEEVINYINNKRRKKFNFFRA
jgi:hypothetical protein